MRQAFLTVAVAAVLIATANACIYPFGSRSKSAADPEKHFDYNFAGRDWAEHNSSTWTCNGNKQSPLLLHVQDKAPTAVVPASQASTFAYGVLDSSTMDVQLLNNGHTFLLNFPNASTYEANVTIVVAGSNKTLVQAFEQPSSSTSTVRATPIQLHFHARSEHVVDGVVYPTEMHIVHSVSQAQWPACPSGGCLLVLGALFHLTDDPAEAIPALDTILQYAPVMEDGTAAVPAGKQIDIDSLLPKSRQLLMYSGSLTTPPCTEGILWHVLTQSVPITHQQLTTMMTILGDKECEDAPTANATSSGRRLFEAGGSGSFAFGPDGCRSLETAHNWRDVQPTNGRTIKIAKAA